MTSLVFFLEEPSAKEMLKGLLPKIMPDHIAVQYVVFEGKQDLEKRLPKKLKAWQRANSLFVVLRDQDGGDCVEIKANLRSKVLDAGKPNVLIRIACHELESFYLGDLAAISNAFGLNKITHLQNNQKYRDPDRLSNPVQELERLAPNYQKVSGSRAIGPYLDVSNNRSKSFNVLVRGIQKLIEL